MGSAKQWSIILFVFFSVINSSQATTIVTGEIYPVFDELGYHNGTTVDHWYFTVHSDGLVIIDVLSWETDLDDFLTADGLFEVVDVNKDGEIAFFDGVMHLYRDDGNLTEDYSPENFIDSADDYSIFFGGADDGSISDNDPYMPVELKAGNYVLAIATYEFEAHIAGYDTTLEDGRPPVTCSAAQLHSCQVGESHDHGDYQITFSGDLSVTNRQIAEPGALLINLLGLLVLFTLMHKRVCCRLGI